VTDAGRPEGIEEELERVMAQVTELGERRFTLGGGMIDAVVRNQIEDLQVRANELSARAGRPTPYTTSDGAASDRLPARLRDIEDELRLLSQPPGTPNDAIIDKRESLEREAAGIRAVLGKADTRPSLPRGPQRGGWAILIGAVVLIVLALAASSQLL
jgi:hypothetical protein